MWIKITGFTVSLFCSSLIAQASTNCQEDKTSPYADCLASDQYFTEELALAKGRIVLNQLKQSLKSKNLEEMSKWILFPLTISSDTVETNAQNLRYRTTQIHNITQLKTNFELIFSSTNIAFIECLEMKHFTFDAGKGLMANNGSLWLFDTFVGDQRTFKLGHIDVSPTKINEWVKRHCEVRN